MRVCVKREMQTKCKQDLTAAKLPDRSASLNLKLQCCQFTCVYITFAFLIATVLINVYKCICFMYNVNVIIVNYNLEKCRLLLSLLLGSCLVELLEFGQRRNVLGGSAAAHSACGNCKCNKCHNKI